ncbi:MAG: type IV pilus assembly protein PilM, partial [Kiritimatiellales bacterium]|nr:type IV pilus assembly protein PilM [Kiritimatiellales bacterium]
MKSNKFIALDIGDSGVKIAEFAQHGPGQIELLKYGFASLDMDPQNESMREAVVASTIQELLKEKKIAPGATAVALTGQSVFSRLVKLPPVEKEKISQMVEYEAVQNVPFPIDEVVWDYQIIDNPQSDDREVLLVAIKADMVESLAHAVEMTGLSPEIFDVSSISIYNAVRHNYRDLSGAVLVVDVGARSSNLIFIDGDRAFMRSLPVAGNAITQQIAQELNISFAAAEALKIQHAEITLSDRDDPVAGTEKAVVLKCVRNTMNRMYQEISRSITFYRNQQDGQQPGLLLLTGGTARLPGIGAILENRLQMKVEFLDPLQKVKIGPKVDTAGMDEITHQFGELVGLALRHSIVCPIQINLMPARLLKERAFLKKQPVLLACAAGIVLLAGIWAAGLSFMAKLAKEEAVGVSARVNELSKVENSLKAEEAALKQLNSHRVAYEQALDKRTVWLETLMDLQQTVPDGMFL